MSAARPCFASERRMTLAIRGSSSTTSTRIREVSRAFDERRMNVFEPVIAGSPGGRTVGAMKKLIAPIAVAVALAGCGSSDHPKPRFSSSVDNPWFPLKPGTRWEYRGVKDGKPSRDVVTVEHAAKTIQGAPCAVVTDLLYLKGRLEERTTDWYTQDAAGNVW